MSWYRMECGLGRFGGVMRWLDCSTQSQHPQTFRANQGPVKYYLRKRPGLHGIKIYSNDLAAAAAAGLVLARGSEAGGVKSDGEIGISARAPQSAYAAAVEQMKAKNSNYALDTRRFPTDGRAAQGSRPAGHQPEERKCGTAGRTATTRGSSNRAEPTSGRPYSRCRPFPSTDEEQHGTGDVRESHRVRQS